jgi:predicted nuclease of restriction endonuclease-like RecB superfamily
MAFKVSDFKKTNRGAGEARVIYPHQIRDGRHTAAIGFAISYYERMVGRRRGEFEADALLEFFGDPRLARGLVACLASTYAWRTPGFATALGEATAAALAAASVARPSDLRARLYELANARYGGFVPPDERLAVLGELAADLDIPLAAADLERALGLDASDQQVLAKQGVTPDPDQIVSRYNYHSLETAICYAGRVRLRLEGPVWSILRSAHNLGRRYNLGYSIGDLPGSLFDSRLDLTLHGRRDALGGWGRSGRRLTRALLRLLAAHPGCAVSGEAEVHMPGGRATLRLDERALAMLGSGAADSLADDAWDDALLSELQRAWGRAILRGQTDGWRIRRDPEPLVGEASLVLPDFALRRNGQGMALCLAGGRAQAESLALSLRRLGGSPRVIVLARATAAAALRGSGAAVITYDEGPAEALPKIVSALGQAATEAKAA